MRWFLGLLLFWVVGVSFATATNIRVVGYNIEGGYKSGAEIATVARYMKKVGHADIWALSEVTISWEKQLIAAAGGRYVALATANAIDTTDTLMLLINTERFRVQSYQELNDVKVQPYSRPPLVATLEDISTGKVFQIMVNHLERGDAKGRHKQATKLNQYASKVALPLVAMGDYNFDWDLNKNGQSRDKGYDLMTKNGVFSWVKPEHMIKTNCSKKYNSILDFAFVTDKVKAIKSDVLLRAKEFCEDNRKKPDHRPVELWFSL